MRLPQSVFASIALLLAATSCTKKQSSIPYPQQSPLYAPYPPPPGQQPPPPGPWTPPSGQSGGYYPTPQPPAPQQPQPQPQQPTPWPWPAPTTLPPAVAGSYDATGSFTSAYIRAQPARVVAELVAALPDGSRNKVASIPTIVIEDPKEVNAFAGCNKTSSAFVAITTPLLIFHARAAEARAFDEVFQTAHYESFVKSIAAEIRSGRAIQGPAPGTLPAPQALDPRKLARQQILFDEQLAFVLGHELAHHYRGHTGCVASSGATVVAEDIARVVSSAVPFLNQPNEIDSDVQGIHNLLSAGAKRQSGAWSETGAMMTLDLFSRLQSLGVEDMLLGFLATHPPPQLRMPIVQNAASQWRSSGGKPSSFPFPFPIGF